jgi:hypothetical protein
VLEDDCVAHPDFVRFCEMLLERYAEDERVAVVTRNNFQRGRRRGQASYAGAGRPGAASGGTSKATCRSGPSGRRPTHGCDRQPQSPVSRDVIGVGIFLREQDRPRFPRWANQAQAPLLQVALRRVLPDWLAREPDNPYVAVFAPLLIDDNDDLRARAQGLWRTVQEASLAPEIREILGQVLEFWFFERFRGLTAKEIWAMLNLVTPIQETKAYQSIYAEGKAESLKRLLTRRFGPLPAGAEHRIDTAPVVQLDAWLDGIFDAASLEDLIGDDAG